MTKVCKKCGVEKPIDSFYRKKSTGEARRDTCKECGRGQLRVWQKDNREKTRASTNQWRAKNPEKVAAQERKKRYGITQEQYAGLKSGQNNCCACCGETFIDSPHVDHCHNTGKVRGLLCADCNLGLGRFKDSPGTLQKAIQYLLRTK